MIVSPHPATWRSTHRIVEYGRKALERIGAPVDLFQCIAEPTHAAARFLLLNALGGWVAGVKKPPKATQICTPL